jgi:hypothetical protein
MGTPNSGDVLCCIDANFSQKRRRSANRDPPIHYDNSRFLSNEVVSNMEKYINKLRGAKDPKKGKKTSKNEHRNVDHFLPVREAILDDCENSFVAAQQNVIKASKNFFDDTGLMAILCRHDRTLWVVNITTPGERQHYVFALIETLFRHLPAKWTIGLMYDIGCQLERTMRKV